MNNLPIIRSSGWEATDAATARISYDQIKAVISERKPEVIIQINDVIAPTQAELRGLYVRELFTLYSMILEVMRSGNQWIAMNVHQNYHTRNVDAGTITIEEDEVDILTYHLNPQVFIFPWVDNTLDNPWTPWDWKIPIISDDQDDTNYFYEPDTLRLIVHEGSDPLRICFYGFKPLLTVGLNFFETI
jgi:hypothetical protein